MAFLLHGLVCKTLAGNAVSSEILVTKKHLFPTVKSDLLLLFDIYYTHF